MRLGKVGVPEPFAMKPRHDDRDELLSWRVEFGEPKAIRIALREQHDMRRVHAARSPRQPDFLARRRHERRGCHAEALPGASAGEWAPLHVDVAEPPASGCCGRGTQAGAVDAAL